MIGLFRVNVSVSLVVALAAIVIPAFAEIPDGVSPGAVDRIAEIEGRCPTFSWSPVPGASFHELVGYRLPDQIHVADLASVELSATNQDLYVRVPGGASAWEPELAECLTPGGNYIWFVRAVFETDQGDVAEVSEWSIGRLFSISTMPSAEELEDALAVLRRYAGNGDRAGSVVRTPVGETERPGTGHRAPSPRHSVSSADEKAVTSAQTAIRGSLSSTVGETYGVVGVSASADGAGLGAANTAGGPDLVLDGSADFAPDTLLSESGIDRPWGTPQVFNIGNSAGSGMTLQVDGVDALTTASGLNADHLTSGTVPSARVTGTYSEAISLTNASNSFAGNGSGLTSLNGSNVTTGTVADPRVASTITRDGEVMPIVMANDGPGSGLNADLLDGINSTGFAGSGHGHFGHSWAGTSSAGLHIVNGGGVGLEAGTSANNSGVFGTSSGSGNSSHGLKGGMPGNTASCPTGATECGSGLYVTASGDAYASFVYGENRSGMVNVQGDNGYYGLWVSSLIAPDGSGIWTNGASSFTDYVTFSAGKSGYVVDVALNDGTEVLEKGDIVVISGFDTPVVGNIPVVRVRKATQANATGVIGVVDVLYRPCEITESLEAGQACGGFESSTSTISPGEYLSVVTLGAYEAVKADASLNPIRPGDLVTTSDVPGLAMSATPLMVDGVSFHAPGTIVGKALGGLDEGTGVIPVFVSSR
jgi:hypothetical protein